MSTTIKIATKTGAKMANAERMTADIPSVVEKTQFPVPAVILLDISLEIALPLWMVAAAPPPMINPITHFIHSLSDGKTDVIKSVPAAIDKGISMLSITLSIKGM